MPLCTYDQTTSAYQVGKKQHTTEKASVIVKQGFLRSARMNYNMKTEHSNTSKQGNPRKSSQLRKKNWQSLTSFTEKLSID